MMMLNFSPGDMAIIAAAAFLLFCPQKFRDRLDPKVVLKYTKIFMGLFLFGVLAYYAFLRHEWYKVFGCMPFAVALLPQFECLLRWSFQQRYPAATALLVVLFPIMMTANLIGMSFKVGLWNAAGDTLLKIGYCILVAVVTEVVSRHSSRNGTL